MIANSLDREYILNELRALKSELRDRYKVSKIDIFGSVARNEATEDSDIDIVVEIEPNILKRIGLKRELEEKLGKRVDVIRYWHGMNKYLKARIERETVYT